MPWGERSRYWLLQGTAVHFPPSLALGSLLNGAITGAGKSGWATHGDGGDHAGGTVVLLCPRQTVSQERLWLRLKRIK